MMNDWHFRVDYGLLWAYTLVKYPQIIKDLLLTMCANVINVCMK